MKKNIFLGLLVVVQCFHEIKSQPFDPGLFKSLKWRMIGPYRGGRTVGAVGVPQQPNVFYIGVNNGGVWKTTDYGRTWDPVFDDQPTGSIGDVAVAPSSPDVVYVGSGEGIQRPDLSVGNGIYKSTDAGKNWVHLGLDDVQQVGGLAIDPKNENRVFVAALGHPYGPNTERGVYRTVDGGKTWEKVLYKDENTGAIQVTIDPNNPEVVYADMWAGRQGPWENGQWSGPGSGLFKSTDGGTTWKQLTNGLPTTKQGLGRIGFCIAPSDSRRMYATVDAGASGGIYRSDDAGESWQRMNADERYWGRGDDFAEVKVDPGNPDILYTADVVVWKSIDAGKSWNAFRGAPGGDDYHRIWINPNNPSIILIASDQGAIITVNGGLTFSSWYNQPTGQMYHVSADNAFPYNVYSGQQESGSVGITSRGNDGQITSREWHPVGAEEYGYVCADPLDPNIIYGGKISRFDKRTGQVQDISPDVLKTGKFRFLRTAPVLFSPIDKKTLYFAGNVLFKTRDGGKHWQIISNDLSRQTWDIPESVGIYTSEDLLKMPRRGVIYTVAPSPVDSNTIWCGTDDGLIHITKNGGKTWDNITPSSITAWSKISMLEASHTDVNTAYAAVNRIRVDDMHPHIYKTSDGGKSWKEIVNGLPNDPINVIKEDPLRKGLLFAGSEKNVYVSFDEGVHWQSLRLNMPATSIRDLVIKDDDIVVATHGRSFWILDNMSLLRQINRSNFNARVILFKPSNPFRVRWDMWTDTPMPQEEPAGENPPDGMLIDYYLSGEPLTPVTLEIFDNHNQLVRKFSSSDTFYRIPEVNIPLYWVRPQQTLSSASGSHRFTWDMHYTPLNIPPAFPISAIYQNTAPLATSPWVMPGNYKVALTVDGKSYTQTFTVRMDPRVRTSMKDLQQQHDLSFQCYHHRSQVIDAMDQLKILQSRIEKQLQNDPANKKLLALQQEVAALLTSPPGSSEITFNSLNASLAALFNILQGADVSPTSQAIGASYETERQFKMLWEKWKSLLIKTQHILQQ